MRVLFKSILTMTILGIALTSFSQGAFANQCALRALAETKQAQGNQQALKRIYDTYFGEALARMPVAKQWAKMSVASRKAQVDRARRIVVSLASKLAPYANATYTWNGNVGTYRLGNKTGKITVSVAKGCQMNNICIKDTGCLSAYIGDARKYAKNE